MNIRQLNYDLRQFDRNVCSITNLPCGGSRHHRGLSLRQNATLNPRLLKHVIGSNFFESGISLSDWTESPSFKPDRHQCLLFRKWNWRVFEFSWEVGKSKLGPNRRKKFLMFEWPRGRRRTGRLELYAAGRQRCFFILFFWERQVGPRCQNTTTKHEPFCVVSLVCLITDNIM